MSRYLILIRHAKSDWSQHIRDFKRPLKKRGRRDAERVGVWLAQQKLIPDLVIASPAERTKSTALKILRTMTLSPDLMATNKSLYLSSQRKYFKNIKQTSENINNLIVVGHNPVMEELVCNLLANSKHLKKLNKSFSTAAVAVFKVQGQWKNISKKNLSIVNLIKPKHLPRTYPYPDFAGTEQRKRPAYYYQQSGVIPYRIEKGKLKILLISSSNGSHYILPKGIKEHNLSLRESAEKEALEEAGIKGIVEKKSIGAFQFKKWGAACQVAMYPMLVISMQGKYKWQETHRERHWVSVKKAKEMLKEKYFLKLIDKLILHVVSRKS